ncbi:CFC_collapsed_G0057490.mRNA.1.CDS.1 [Saccharomyces cerevisiae]|nr:CFC_collapsed_G0057490.mRNA.1.CDS.1 [Saccharomyces cerevisiae]
MGWKDISQYFPSRTPNACQFRWRRLKSGNLKSNKTALIDINTYTGPLKITHGDETTNVQQKPSKKVEENVLTEDTAEFTTTSSIPIPSRKTSLPSFHASMSFSQSPSNVTPLRLSQTLLLPCRQTLTPSPNSLNQDPIVRSNDEEKYGFIPKFVCLSATGSNNHYSVFSKLFACLTQLKVKKGLAFGIGPADHRLIFPSNNTSRRSSMILAPNSVSNIFNVNNSGSNTASTSNTNSRRESVIKKEFQQRLNNLSNSEALPPTTGPFSPTLIPFMDLPHSSSVSSSSTLHKSKRGSFSGHSMKSSCNPTNLWSKDEDALLMENKKRNLSVMELSILLPQRTEVEIQWRLNALSSDADMSASHILPLKKLWSKKNSSKNVQNWFYH